MANARQRVKPPPGLQYWFQNAFRHHHVHFWDGERTLCNKQLGFQAGGIILNSNPGRYVCSTCVGVFAKKHRKEIASIIGCSIVDAHAMIASHITRIHKEACDIVMFNNNCATVTAERNMIITEAELDRLIHAAPR